MTNILQKALVVTLILCGIISLMLSLVMATGLNTAVVSDRWVFMIRQEGVTDENLVYRIADRLSNDRNHNWWMVLTNGLVLMAGGIYINRMQRKVS